MVEFTVLDYGQGLSAGRRKGSIGGITYRTRTPMVCSGGTSRKEPMCCVPKGFRDLFGGLDVCGLHANFARRFETHRLHERPVNDESAFERIRNIAADAITNDMK